VADRTPGGGARAELGGSAAGRAAGGARAVLEGGSSGGARGGPGPGRPCGGQPELGQAAAA
jgi:hypothetical protein